MKRIYAAMCFISWLVFLSSPAHADIVNMNSESSSLLSLSNNLMTNNLKPFSDSMTTFTVTTTVVNETNFTWTGYTITLNPDEDAIFIPGTGGSTRFLKVEYPDDWTINYSAPNTVAIGGAVTFQFDIGIPDSAPYSYTLTYNPIPEPATAVLLTLGGTILFKLRRKSRK